MSETQNTSPYKGSGQLTREQFLFYEMRTTAKLMAEGLDDGEVIKRIVDDNLFQYPTEKSLASISKACIARLYALDDRDLMTAITTQPMDTAKQVSATFMANILQTGQDSALRHWMQSSRKQVLCH